MGRWFVSKRKSTLSIESEEENFFDSNLIHFEPSFSDDEMSELSIDIEKEVCKVDVKK